MIEFKRDMTQFFNTLLTFKDEEPILVLYNRELKGIEYRQRGNATMLFYLNDYFIHKPFKRGVIYPNDLALMKHQLHNLIGDQIIENGAMLSITTNTLNIYYPSKHNLEDYGPVWAYSLKFVPSTSRFMIWFAAQRSKSFKM